MLLGSLGGQAVYGTLVPSGSTVNPAVQVTSSTSFQTFAASSAALASDGQALYVAPEPSSIALAFLGVFGLALATWRRRRR
jgi:hypothetical protein